MASFTIAIDHKLLSRILAESKGLPVILASRI